MKKLNIQSLFLYLFVLLFITSCSNKQSIPVWEITKENSPTSYIIGITEYLNKNADGELITQEILSYFDSSDLIISQIDAKNSSYSLTNEKIGLENGIFLQDVLTNKDYESLIKKKKAFDKEEKNSFPFPDSSKMKLIFYLQDLLFTIKKDNFYFDYLWQQRAFGMQKEKIGLETYQEFYGTQSEIKLSEQVDFMNSIPNFKAFSSNLSSEINDLYLEGKYLEIQEKYLMSFPYLKNNYNSFFTNKHKHWVTKLNLKLQEKRCFISVDVIHLFGANNLLEVLKSKGYGVKKCK